MPRAGAISLGMWAVFARRRDDPVDRAAGAARAAGPDEDIETANPRVFRRMWRLPLAWALTVGFTVSGVLAYTSFAWLPTILVDTAGVTPAAAGALLSLFAAMGLPSLAARADPGGALQRHAALFGVAVAAGLIGDRRACCSRRRRPPGCGWRCSGSRPLLFPLTLVLLGLRVRTHEALGRAERLRAEHRLRDRGAVPVRNRPAARRDRLVDAAAHHPRRRGRGSDPGRRRRGPRAHESKTTGSVATARGDACGGGHPSRANAREVVARTMARRTVAAARNSRRPRIEP